MFELGTLHVVSATQTINFGHYLSPCQYIRQVIVVSLMSVLQTVECQLHLAIYNFMCHTAHTSYLELAAHHKQTLTFLQNTLCAKLMELNEDHFPTLLLTPCHCCQFALET